VILSPFGQLHRPVDFSDAEFCKRRRGIWQNLPRKTVGPRYECYAVTVSLLYQPKHNTTVFYRQGQKIVNYDT